MIPESKWEWYGTPGHCCVGQWCRFHLHTVVGEYIISTIGQYVHPSDSQGRESSDYAYLKNHPNGGAIGHGRCYETMVFPAGKRCKTCDCGQILPADWSELEMLPANTRQQATANHMQLCYKYSMKRK